MFNKIIKNYNKKQIKYNLNSRLRNKNFKTINLF